MGIWEPVCMKIISGGQTGADRAALDVAIELGMDYGGAVPKGRMAEDGPLAPKYDKMTELDDPEYDVRTKKNILDADATIVFTYKTIGGGSALTMELAEEFRKPYLHIDLSRKTDSGAIEEIREWLNTVHPGILNIAGSRESTSEGIYLRVFNILKAVLP